MSSGLMTQGEATTEDVIGGPSSYASERHVCALLPMEQTNMIDPLPLGTNRQTNGVVP